MNKNALLIENLKYKPFLNRFLFHEYLMFFITFSHIVFITFFIVYRGISKDVVVLSFSFIFCSIFIIKRLLLKRNFIEKFIFKENSVEIKVYNFNRVNIDGDFSLSDIDFVVGFYNPRAQTFKIDLKIKSKKVSILQDEFWTEELIWEIVNRVRKFKKVNINLGSMDYSKFLH